MVACCRCTECSLDRLWGPPQLIVDKRVRASPGLVVRRACAPFLAHLLICGERSRGPSGSNLTLPPRCLPGGAAVPGRRFPGPVGEAAAAAGCPDGWDSWPPPRQGSHTLSLREPCLDSPAACGGHGKGANRIFLQHTSAEIKRTCCSNLSNYLPPFFPHHRQ